MKKLILIFSLMITTQAFSSAALIFGGLEGQNSKAMLAGILTTTTTIVFGAPLSGLLFYLDDGKTLAVNANHPVAMDLIQSAEEKISNGESLDEYEAAMLELLESAEL